MIDIDKTKSFGVVDYADGTYTDISPMTISAETQLTNDKSVVTVENLPYGCNELWDSTTNKIVGIQDGINYNYSTVVSFKAKTGNNNNSFQIFLRDGDNVYDRNPQTGIFTKGIVVENAFEFNLPFYSGELQRLNGFKIMLSAGLTGNYDIYGITIQINKYN